MTYPPDPTSVYEIHLGKKVLYVGCSRNPRNRLYGLRCKHHLPPGTTLVIYKTFPNRGLALTAERRRIRQLIPPYNDKHATIYRDAMPAKEARRIWRSPEYANLYLKELMELMPGWTPQRAKDRFGRRPDFPEEEESW